MPPPIPLDPAACIAHYKARCVSFPETGCWLWRDLGWHPDSRSPHYPEGNYAGKKWRLNRLMLALSQRPLGSSEVSCHRCDNHLCINPAHLFIGTQRDNIQDGISKGRQQFHPSHYTHCKHGHEFTPENTRINRHGHRNCKACEREKQHAPWYIQWRRSYQKQQRDMKRQQRSAQNGKALHE